MCKMQITRFFIGLSFVLALAAPGLAQSGGGRPADECEKKPGASRFADPDLLSRAEQRAEALRAQLFDLQMKEIDLQTRIDDLDYELTPHRIERALAFVGSVRPLDELRQQLRTKLEREKTRLNKQLEQLELRKERLEAAISEAEAGVERLRQSYGSP